MIYQTLKVFPPDASKLRKSLTVLFLQIRLWLLLQPPVLPGEDGPSPGVGGRATLPTVPGTCLSLTLFPSLLEIPQPGSRGAGGPGLLPEDLCGHSKGAALHLQGRLHGCRGSRKGEGRTFYRPSPSQGGDGGGCWRNQSLTGLLSCRQAPGLSSRQASKHSRLSREQEACPLPGTPPHPQENRGRSFLG